LQRVKTVSLKSWNKITQDDFGANYCKFRINPTIVDCDQGVAIDPFVSVAFFMVPYISFILVAIFVFERYEFVDAIDTSEADLNLGRAIGPGCPCGRS